MLVLLYMLDSHTHRSVKLTEIIDCPKNATHYFNCSEIFTTMGTGLYTIDLKCQTVL